MDKQKHDEVRAEVDRLLAEKDKALDDIPRIPLWREHAPSAPATDSVKEMEASAQACERMWADIDAVKDRVAVLQERAAEYGCGCAEPAARLVSALDDLRAQVQGNREFTRVFGAGETNFRDADLALQGAALGRPVYKLDHTLSVFIGAVYDDLEQLGFTGKQDRCELTRRIAFLVLPNHPLHNNGPLTWRATLSRINNPPGGKRDT